MVLKFNSRMKASGGGGGVARAHVCVCVCVCVCVFVFSVLTAVWEQKRCSFNWEVMKRLLTHKSEFCTSFWEKRGK